MAISWTTVAIRPFYAQKPSMLFYEGKTVEALHPSVPITVENKRISL